MRMIKLILLLIIFGILLSCVAKNLGNNYDNLTQEEREEMLLKKLDELEGDSDE